MKFVPATSEELAAERAKFGPWPRGAYDFEIAFAEDKISKNGNEMIELEFLVFDSYGNKKKVKDWLVASIPSKLKAVCEAVGLHDAYEGGNIAAHDFEGRTGKLKLGIDRQEGYDDRNKVSGYVSAERRQRTGLAGEVNTAPPARSKIKTPAGDLDDEIPF